MSGASSYGKGDRTRPFDGEKFRECWEQIFGKEQVMIDDQIDAWLGMLAFVATEAGLVGLHIHTDRCDVLHDPRFVYSIMGGQSIPVKDLIPVEPTRKLAAKELIKFFEGIKKLNEETIEKLQSVV